MFFLGFEKQANRYLLGAGVGSGIGAVSGALSSDKHRVRNAFIGAGIGAGVGAGAAHLRKPVATTGSGGKARVVKMLSQPGDEHIFEHLKDHPITKIFNDYYKTKNIKPKLSFGAVETINQRTIGRESEVDDWFNRVTKFHPSYKHAEEKIGSEYNNRLHNARNLHENIFPSRGRITKIHHRGLVKDGEVLSRADVDIAEFKKQAKELVTGGKADGKPTSKFPAEQISMGKKVEREHTKNPAMAEEIAKDHLTEDKKYYSHLKEMEDKYVKTAGIAKGVLSGLLGVSEFSGEQIARKAGTGVRRAIVPAGAATAGATIVKNKDNKDNKEKEESTVKTAFAHGFEKQASALSHTLAAGGALAAGVGGTHLYNQAKRNREIPDVSAAAAIAGANAYKRNKPLVINDLHGKGRHTINWNRSDVPETKTAGFGQALKSVGTEAVRQTKTIGTAAVNMAKKHPVGTAAAGLATGAASVGYHSMDPEKRKKLDSAAEHMMH